mmetsp:Transcript_25850/g.40091  ORF Transcript_25850/g.40091 Transcript_25850/m.40091 type:complete len:207 (+) Transcript_25850:159-779(+)
MICPRVRIALDMIFSFLSYMHPTVALQRSTRSSPSCAVPRTVAACTKFPTASRAMQRTNWLLSRRHERMDEDKVPQILSEPPAPAAQTCPIALHADALTSAAGSSSMHRPTMADMYATSTGSKQAGSSPPCRNDSQSVDPRLPSAPSAERRIGLVSSDSDRSSRGHSWSLRNKRNFLPSPSLSLPTWPLTSGREEGRPPMSFSMAW